MNGRWSRNPAIEMKPTCVFCKGRPVGNAARLTGGEGPRFLPCPRCGAEPPEELQNAAIQDCRGTRNRGIA